MLIFLFYLRNLLLITMHLSSQNNFLNYIFVEVKLLQLCIYDIHL